jgi:enoyl-CoA hydratase/carnithine racemase
VEFETLHINKNGPAQTVTLSRPANLNAITPRMAVELANYFRALVDDSTARVIVIRGAGRAFCASVDIKQTVSVPEDQRRGFAGVEKEFEIQRLNRQFILEMRRCPQPIVAQLHGAACGAGFALALASDIRIATSDARMNCAFVNVGLGGCDIGASYILSRLIEASLATELILTGRFISASRAEALGLVSRVMDSPQIEEAIGTTVDELLRVSPVGLRLPKEMLRFAIDGASLESVIAMEDRNQALCARTPDYHEAAAAFAEQRDPRWVSE